MIIRGRGLRRGFFRGMSPKSYVSATNPDAEETIAGNVVFSCSWSGTDVLNSDGGDGHAFDSETDTGNKLSQGTTANAGFNSEQSKYLTLVPTVTAAAYVTKGFAYGSYGARFGFYVVTGWSSDSGIRVFYIRNVALTQTLIYVNYRRVSGVHVLSAYIRNSSDADVQVGSDITISTATWYQVRIKCQKNTAGDDAGAGASFEVYNEAGQVGTTQVLASGTTTKNTSSDSFMCGTNTAVSSAPTIIWDVVAGVNDYNFPNLYAW
jgi:hypothetical protein